MKFTELMKQILPQVRRTCSITNQKPDSLAYINSTANYARFLTHRGHAEPLPITLLCPPVVARYSLRPELLLNLQNLTVIEDTNFMALFIRAHNRFNKNLPPENNQISNHVSIDEGCVIGAEGMKFAWDFETGDLIMMKHMGNVVIEDNVVLGPCVTIVRGTLGSTIIKSGCRIGSQCHIGHNATIGHDVFMTPGIRIGGSAKIGNGCWFGMGAIVRDNVTIADGIRIGMGAVVTKDLIKPGTYIGNPATFTGDYNGEL